MHARLLGDGRQVIHKLSEDHRIQATAAPTLHHIDLHKRNIFVSDDDPALVTDIIDWQSSSIEPGFDYATLTPDFAGPKDESLEDQEREELRAELCQKAYDVCMKGLVPRLAAARALDMDLARPFRYCHRTWRDSIPAFRQDLIDLSVRWEALDLPGQCPYHVPVGDELALHKEQYEDLKLAADLRGKIYTLRDAGSDGWVSNDMWPKVQAYHKEVFAGFLSTVKEMEGTEGESMTEEKLRTMWPFDIP